MSKINTGLIPMDFIKEQLKDAYSTTETLTNKTFLNKPVYRKVIPFSSLSSSTRVSHNINNFGILVDVSGRFTRSDTVGSSYPLIKLEVDSTFFTQWYFGIESVSTTEVNFSIGTSILPKIDSGYIILEYTKTTD